MLQAMHKQGTSANPPMFTFKTNITIDKINKDKFNESIKDETIKNYASLCYNKYNEEYPKHLFGTPDCDPQYWVSILLNELKKMFEKNDNSEIILPNGCCTSKECSINNFYYVILKQLL
jgi:hypothetical protein